MEEGKLKYSTAFTCGALLLRETEAFISAINSSKNFLDGMENIDFNVIPVNSEKSKKTLKHEIAKRVKAINNERLLDSFLTLDKNGKNVLLYYGICKCYPIIKHFMLEVVLKKWQNLDYDLEISDFTNFLHRKMGFHSELQKITENSIYKSSQVALKMLIGLGMLHKNRIQKIAITNTVLRECCNAGDLWFLDVLLLSELEKQEI
jgi:hypothetical protein